MRLSLNWLKEFVSVPDSPEELAHQMTMAGMVVEAIERPGAKVENVVVGQILSIEPHPSADRLVVCRTEVGKSEPLQIICGAKNMRVGDKVPTAQAGSSLPGGLKIERRKMRGVESQGMMCSSRELGLGDDHEGLLILDSTAPVGEDVVSLLGLDDIILDFEITPNRGDWAGMIGAAREIAALYGQSLTVPVVRLSESDPAASDLSSVEIEAPDLCPRYAGRVLTDVKIGPSPHWLAQRLRAAGLRPINNVVDVTNYVLLETGHPLHAFDYDKLIENRIVVREAKRGETIRTIDGQVRNLEPRMLVIADAANPVAVAGVMGGADSEVGESTTRVFLESAYFDRRSIRKTARALGMQTEASVRFQRGADPEIVRYAIDRAAALISEVAQAKVTRGVLDAYPKAIVPLELTLRYDRTNLLLGTAIPAEVQRKKLSSLGFKISRETATECRVTVPTWRHDVQQEADLIEDVARLYGYENIPVSMPMVRQTDVVLAPHEKILFRLRRYLAGQGLTEFMNMTFSNEQLVRKTALSPAHLEMVKLVNPLSESQAAMRTSLLPGLLNTTSLNIRQGATSIKAFEIGPVFIPVNGRDLPDEPQRLGIILAGLHGDKHWSQDLASLDFFDLKGYAEAVLAFFGVSGVFAPVEDPTFLPGHCGRILLEGRELGRLGEISPSVQQAFDIHQPVYALEIDLEPLLSREKPHPQFQPTSVFPPSTRDMAVLVDEGIPAGDLCAAILEVEKDLLRKVRIFDVYTGEQLPRGKKSLAFSLVFQSDEKTLTDDDTQKIWEKILRKLRDRFGAELR